MKKFTRVWLLGAALLVGMGASLRAADPEPAKKNGYTINLEVDVSEQGKAERVVLLNGDDDTNGAMLTKLAMAMAGRTEFPPRQKDGHAVKYKVRAPYFFPIEDDEGAQANEQPRPVVKDAIQPGYPLAEAKAGEVGGAILELIIGADGKVTSLKTLRASKPSFEQAAVQAVKQWTFIPAVAGERAVETRWRMAVVFESSAKMADVKFRVPPRPSLGSFIVVHNEDAPESPAPAKAEEIPPAVTTPAK